MDTSNNNRLNMIDATIGFCDGNTGPTSGITNFALVLSDVKAKRLLIHGMNQVGSNGTAFVTLDVQQLKKVMISKALKCANATLAFANSVDNNTLKGLVNFTESKLKKMSKSDVSDACQQIHDATDANFADAEPFGIVASDVTDLQAAIDLYRLHSSDTDEAIITKSQAKKQAKRMVRELIDELLIEQMDKMVNTIKETEEAYHSSYFQARIIKNLGTTHTKVRGTVKDEEDVPLVGVTFTIFETGTEVQVAQVESVVKGKFSANKLPSGNFDLVWTKDGYKEVKEENVHLGPGKELSRKVVMEKSTEGVAVREADVAIGTIADVETESLAITDETMVTVEISGNIGELSAAASAGTVMGPVIWSLGIGTVTKTLAEFIALVGLNDTNTFLKVRNNGPMVLHYKITFTGLSN